MPSFQIPLTTLPVGVQEFGPMVVNNADNLIRLSIDRTVAGDQINGGIYTNTKTGLVVVTDYVEVDLIAGPQRRAKASITVFGAAVTVAGSLVTS